MTTRTQYRPAPRRPTPARRASGRRVPVLAIAGGLVAVLAIAAVIATSGGGDGGGDASVVQEVRPVEVVGDPLPELVDPASDPAVGTPAPVVDGATFTGTPVSVGGAGPQLVVFVAHWCPHCQAEVPVITDWIAAGGLPEGFTLRAVSTGVQTSAPNFPPSAWLAEEGWPVATLADDEALSAAAAFGVSAYPFFVAIDGDGDVVARATGELGIDAFEELIAAAR